MATYVSHDLVEVAEECLFGDFVLATRTKLDMEVDRVSVCARLEIVDV